MPLPITTETVPIGEIKSSDDKTCAFVIPGLSASIAVVFFDTRRFIGAIANILLPDNTTQGYNSRNNAVENERDGCYANLAIPMLFEEYTRLGGKQDTLIIKMAGGAQLFNFGGGSGNSLNVGARNAAAIRAALSKLGLTIQTADIGGNKTRSFQFYLETGQITIRQAGKPEYTL